MIISKSLEWVWAFFLLLLRDGFLFLLLRYHAVLCEASTVAFGTQKSNKWSGKPDNFLLEGVLAFLRRGAYTFYGFICGHYEGQICMNALSAGWGLRIKEGKRIGKDCIQSFLLLLLCGGVLYRKWEGETHFSKSFLIAAALVEKLPPWKKSVRGKKTLSSVVWCTLPLSEVLISS